MFDNILKRKSNIKKRLHRTKKIYKLPNFTAVFVAIKLLQILKIFQTKLYVVNFLDKVHLANVYSSRKITSILDL